MEGSGDNHWFLGAQMTGNVRVMKGTRNGAPTTELHIRYDCPSKSLLADIVRSAVDHTIVVSAQSSGRLSIATPFVGDGGEVGRAPPPMSKDAVPPVLVAQIGKSRHRGNKEMASIQLTSGRLFFRSETVYVSQGVPHYSENSQLAPPPDGDAPALTRPPALWGQPAPALTNLASASDLEGVCLFFHSRDADGGVLQMGSRQTLLREPRLLLSGRHYRLDSVARYTAAPCRVRPASAQEMKLLLTEPTRSRPGYSPNSGSPSGPPPQRNLLVLAGRCLLRGDLILVLSGLLHFAGRWHRVGSGGGVAGDAASSLPRISGVNLLTRRLQQRGAAARGSADEQRQSEDSDSGDLEMEQAMTSVLDRPLLLSNVRLYAQGGTVFAGKMPLLTGASLVLSPDAESVPLERQEYLLTQNPSAQQMRLFLQSGRFSLSAGGVLQATDGVAWLRAMKVRLGRKKSEQLSVRDALVFPQPSQLQDAVLFEGRDILYKDGLLYLDDLTPLLSGGHICLGQRELPLEWLSGTDDEHRAASTKVLSSPPTVDDLQALASEKRDSEEFNPFLTSGVCVLEPGGRLHLLRGRLYLPGEPAPVIIDQGVAYFAQDSRLPLRNSAAFPPPMMAGRPTTRPRDTQHWAKAVDHRLDRATFEGDLSLGRGAVWLNNRVPLLIGGRLLLNGRWFNDSQTVPPQPLANQTLQAAEFAENPGFTGSYSVYANAKSDALMFSLKARFADGLQFLFSP